MEKRFQMSTAMITGPPINSSFGDDSPRVRRSDPVTSHEAADLANLSKPRNWVLYVLSCGPLADHEVVLLASSFHQPFTPQRIRTARAELTRMGLVEKSGIYRLTENNRRAIVWQIRKAVRA